MTSFIISAEEKNSSDISVSYTSQISVIITSVIIHLHKCKYVQLNNSNFSFYVNINIHTF